MSLLRCFQRTYLYCYTVQNRPILFSWYNLKIRRCVMINYIRFEKVIFTLGCINTYIPTIKTLDKCIVRAILNFFIQCKICCSLKSWILVNWLFPLKRVNVLTVLKDKTPGFRLTPRRDLSMSKINSQTPQPRPRSPLQARVERSWLASTDAYSINPIECFQLAALVSAGFPPHRRTGVAQRPPAARPRK